LSRDSTVRLPHAQLTIRRLLMAMVVVAFGLAGAGSPDTVIAFLSVETLLVGMPLVLAWRLPPTASLIEAMCVWAAITVPAGMLIILFIQQLGQAYGL
jgi:hypothetical protein